MLKCIGYSAVILAGVQALILIRMLFVTRRVNIKRCWIMGILASIVLSIIAFLSFPNGGTDLRRYYHILYEMKSLSTKEIFTEWLYSTTPLTTVLFLTVEKIGIYNLLPAISTAIVVLLHTKIITRQSKMLSTSNASTAMFVISWIGIAGARLILTSVRQNLAAAVVAYAVQRLLVENKRDWKTGILIVIPSLIHNGALPFTAILMMFFLMSKVYWWEGIAGIVLIVAVTKADIDNPIIRYIQYKFQIYSVIKYPDIRFWIVRIIFFAFLAFAWLSSRKALYRLGLGRYFSFWGITAIFTLCMIQVEHLFDRTFIGLVTCSYPIFHCLMDRATIKTEQRNTLIVVIFLFLMTGIYAYQFVDLKTSWRLWDMIVKG